MKNLESKNKEKVRERSGSKTKVDKPERANLDPNLSAIMESSNSVTHTLMEAFSTTQLKKLDDMLDTRFGDFDAKMSKRFTIMKDLIPQKEKKVRG